ncbi:hypothetical protein V6N13_053731 [Hibiscus sabdariffa]|uniref:Uncharacterized protein n=1 Tax=Hibiscus sabdariffa TaxID=183260 RepID=A0ABR2T6Q7_9ROSI
MKNPKTTSKFELKSFTNFPPKSTITYVSPRLHHFPTQTSSSPTIKIKMVVSHGEIDNEENIHPFSSKSPTLVLKKLYPSTPAQSDSTSQALVSHAKCWNKRVENELGSVRNKTCLVYKSGNFR